jgi:ORF6N domain
MSKIIPIEWIQERIYFIRGCKVMLSHDLAHVYGVEPRVLIQAVKRNIERFPADFIFQLENQEFVNLKSQTVISSWGGVRTPPYAFTELGIAMLSTVLNSSHAIQVNIEIMRTFVSLRQFLNLHKELGDKLKQLENKYDYQFKVVFDAIHEFMTPPDSAHREIGIHTKK